MPEPKPAPDLGEPDATEPRPEEESARVEPMPETVDADADSGEGTGEGTGKGSAEDTGEDAEGAGGDPAEETGAEETGADTAEDSAEDSAEGAAEDSAEDAAEDTAEGTAEDTAEGTAEDTAEGTAEDPAEGTAEDPAEETGEDTAETGEEAAAGPAADAGEDAAEETSEETAAGPAADAGEDAAEETSEKTGEKTGEKTTAGTAADAAEETGADAAEDSADESVAVPEPAADEREGQPESDQAETGPGEGEVAKEPVDEVVEQPEEEADSGRDQPVPPVAPVPRPLAVSGPGSTDRLRSALMRPSRAQIVVGVLLAALGFAAVTQVRSNEADATYAGYREQDLIDLLNGLAGASERSQAEINELEQAQRDLQNSTRDRQAALELAQEQADRLSILAGTVPVTGPGIRITIEDPRGEVDISDLLDGIQELRTAGAEAMEFNDEVRVIAQTSFEAASGGVLIRSGGGEQGQFIAPPYVIDVIGEPNELAGALTFPQGLRDAVEEDAGGELTSEELDSVEIESVVQPSSADFAQP